MLISKQLPAVIQIISGYKTMDIIRPTVMTQLAAVQNKNKSELNP